MVDKTVPVGSAHGRFQPLHNAHLEYLLAAKARCKLLLVGLTKYDPSQLNLLGRHRERPDSNPLSYFERTVVIREALMEAGLAASEFAFVPFPIEHPKTLQYFVPTDIPCFTTVCEDWNRQKIAVLREAGYEVVVLWEREPKEISASTVRDLIASDDRNYEAWVPDATRRAVRRLDLRRRLLRLREESVDE